ncbi:MAG TPA: cytochrome c biogenesis protein CcdA [Nitrospiria bacterium]|nr:cytochrome c biogenesis protein CcdA [Nitrospiria bacterium]
MEPTAPISYLIAFTAGLLSFVSPCVLPLVPSYISYITGLSFEELSDRRQSRQVLWTTLRSALIFIAGFSIVFIAFGASATALGQLLLTHQEVIRRIGGALIIVFGLYVMGALKLRWLAPWLAMDKHWRFSERPAGYIGTFLIGVAFAAGWTPCVGPILGSILLYASTTDSVFTGIRLLTAYSFGLGLPLLAVALVFNSALAGLKSVQRHLRAITVGSGLFLVFVGALIFTNSFAVITSFLTRHGIGWYFGQ